MSGDYSPRVAIVTGAAQGIGYSIALRLADDGIDVALNDIPSKADKLNKVAEEIKKKGRRAVAITGDISLETDVQALVGQTVQELGSLDIMVANAGIAPGCPILDITPEQIDAVNSINIRGTILCYKHAAKQMIKQGRGGRIIGASSCAGKQGFPMLSAYCSSKFAVRGITQTAAQEFREHKITVNAYAPGIINTPLSFDLGLVSNVEDKPGVIQCNAPNFGAPVGTESADADVVASIVSYIVKPEAYFITGQSLSVDGGLILT